MSITTLVEAAAGGPLDQTSIRRICEDGKIELTELYDAFAADVATKYSSGAYSWQFCDAAMNSLFTYAHPVSLSGLPSFAFEVYSAFDEGEYHPEGEALSRKLITDALKKKEPNQPLQRNASTGSVSNLKSPARRG